MTSYANRGKGFEDYLELVNGLYRKSGDAVIVKVPTPFLPKRDRCGNVTGCIVRQKSVVDYLGQHKGVPVAVEAKHTEGNRIRFDAVQDHQARFLQEWARCGGRSIVLVSFDGKRFFSVPWFFWRVGRDAAEEGKGTGRFKAVSVSLDGLHWTTPAKASASPEDLLPEWEVEQGGRFALPYLGE